jgi:hypothetical protein
MSVTKNAGFDKSYRSKFYLARSCLVTGVRMTWIEDVKRMEIRETRWLPGVAHAQYTRIIMKYITVMLWYYSTDPLKTESKSQSQSQSCFTTAVYRQSVRLGAMTLKPHDQGFFFPAEHLQL